MHIAVTWAFHSVVKAMENAPAASTMLFNAPWEPSLHVRGSLT